MQKSQRGSALKSDSGKRVALTAPRILREPHIYHASKRLEKPPTGYASKPQVGGGLSGVRVPVHRASLRRGSTVMSLIEGLALVGHDP